MANTPHVMQLHRFRVDEIRRRLRLLGDARADWPMLQDEQRHVGWAYATNVVTEQWSEMKGGAARIEQTIFVERDGQKAIVLGKGGATIKELGSSARAEMEALFGHKVHLFLHVKVRENWADDPAHYHELGLEIPKA